MERLIRSQYWTLVWIAGACLSLMLLVLPRFPDQSCSLPLWLIVLSAWSFAFVVLLIAQFASLRQSFFNLRIQPACFSLALVFFTAAIAIIFSPTAQIDTNWSVSIGAGQLVVMSLGILASILTIERIHSYSQDEASNQASTLQRVTSTRIKHPNSPKPVHNKMGFLSKKSVQAIEAPLGSPPANRIQETLAMPDNAISLEVKRSAEEPNIPQQTFADTAKIDTRKSLQELPAEIRRLPSVNATKSGIKVPDPNRKASSTITKLQALSASGVGSIHHPPAVPEAPVNPDPSQIPELGLRSVLERLDTPDQQQNIDAQLIDSSVHQQSAAPTSIFQQPVDREMDDLFAKITPPEAQKQVQHISQNVAPPTSPSPSISSTSLFKQPVDKEMDDLFAKITPTEAHKEVQHVNQNVTPAFQQPNISPSTTAPPEKEVKLFQGKVDDQVEALFSGIAPEQAQKGVNDFVADKIKQQNEGGFFNVSTEAVTPPTQQNVDLEGLAEQNAIAQGLRDFGRLSIKGSTSVPASAPVGTMKTIGKLLIDSQDVDNIIKKAESGHITVNLPSARVISAVRGEGIQALLENIDDHEGIAGSMLVGEDGLVIASTYTGGGDRDGIGVLAHGMLGNSNLAVLRLDIGELEQMIMVSYLNENTGPRQVTTILTDLEVGALAVFVDSQLVVALDQLLEQISTIARG